MRTIIRAFVIVLALTGAAASAHLSAAAQDQTAGIAAAKSSAFPIPTCPPNDPDACGIQ